MKIKQFVQSLPMFLAFGILTMPEIFSSSLYLILSLLLICPFIISNFFDILRKHKSLCFFFGYTVFFSVLNIPVANSGLGGTINFIVCFTMAIYLLENPRIASNLSFLYCIYIISFLWSRLVVGGDDPNIIYEENLGLSRNFPGYLLVAATSLWCFTKKEVYNTLPVLVPILAVILVFFINGRSSIGAIVLLTFVCIFLRGGNKFLHIMFLILLITIICFFYETIEDAVLMSRLVDEGTENSARDKLWVAYLSDLNPITFFLGIDSNSIPALQVYNGNPHNAFLNWHRRMGLIPLLFILYYCINSLKWYVRNKYIVFALVLSIYLFRIFFDSCSNSTFDFILYYMLLYPYFKEKFTTSNEILNNQINKKFICKILNITKLLA